MILDDTASDMASAEYDVKEEEDDEDDQSLLMQNDDAVGPSSSPEACKPPSEQSICHDCRLISDLKDFPFDFQNLLRIYYCFAHSLPVPHLLDD